MTLGNVEPLHVRAELDETDAWAAAPDARVDTRVLEVIYALDDGARDAFVGQQVDVFIERAATVDAKRDAAARAGS